MWICQQLTNFQFFLLSVHSEWMKCQQQRDRLREGAIWKCLCLIVDLSTFDKLISEFPPCYLCLQKGWNVSSNEIGKEWGPFQNVFDWICFCQRLRRLKRERKPTFALPRTGNQGSINWETVIGPKRYSMSHRVCIKRAPICAQPRLSSSYTLEVVLTQRALWVASVIKTLQSSELKYEPYHLSISPTHQNLKN